MNILLVDNHLLSRDSQVYLFSNNDIKVVGAVSTGHRAMEIYNELEGQVDVVLSEMRLPDMSGLTLIQKISEVNSQQKIAFLTSANRLSIIVEAINKGARGYFSRFISPEMLLVFLQEIMKGYICISPDYLCQLTPLFNDLKINQTISSDALSKQTHFSSREVEVLEMLRHGINNKAIAEKLFISENTVKNHLSSIYGKLGVNNRTQAAALVPSILDLSFDGVIDQKTLKETLRDS